MYMQNGLGSDQMTRRTFGRAAGGAVLVLPVVYKVGGARIAPKGRGLGGVVQHNFFGTMIPYNTVDVEMQLVADSWKKARGNSTGYADMSVQRAPGNCQDLVNVANDHCGLAPEACVGFNIPALRDAMCADYDSWFRATFPKGPGDAYNYDDATYLAKFGAAALAERQRGAVGVVTPGGTGAAYPGGDPFTQNQPWVPVHEPIRPTAAAPAPVPIPVPKIVPAAPPSGGSGSPAPAGGSGSPSGSTPAPSNNTAGDTSDFSFSFSSLPPWALPAAIAAGAAYFMFGGKK